MEDEVQRDEDDEAIQSKALPWRRSEEESEERPKLQEEFKPWIMPYESSPSNTVTGKIRFPFVQIPKKSTYCLDLIE